MRYVKILTWILFNRMWMKWILKRITVKHGYIFIFLKKKNTFSTRSIFIHFASFILILILAMVHTYGVFPGSITWKILFFNFISQLHEDNMILFFSTSNFDVAKVCFKSMWKTDLWHCMTPCLVGMCAVCRVYLHVWLNELIFFVVLGVQDTYETCNIYYMNFMDKPI